MQRTKAFLRKNNIKILLKIQHIKDDIIKTLTISSFKAKKLEELMARVGYGGLNYRRDQ